ncbi:MAG: ParB N-terminal domain-containing protein [Nitrososphaerales archaeon]
MKGLKKKVRLLSLEELKSHEEVEKERLEALTEEIKNDGILKKAIAVDSTNMIILDGHHRVEALKLLGYKKIPVCLFNYDSPFIEIYNFNGGKGVSKEQVIKIALAGKKFPPRTTKHMVRLDDGALVHISELEDDVNIPLDRLS